MATDSNVGLSRKKTFVNFGPIRKFWVFLRARSFRRFNHQSRYFLPLLLMTDSLHQDRRLPLTTLNLCLCDGTAFIFESNKNPASTGPFAVMKFKNGSSRSCRGTVGNYFHSDLFSVPDSSVSCYFFSTGHAHTKPAIIELKLFNFSVSVPVSFFAGRNLNRPPSLSGSTNLSWAAAIAVKGKSRILTIHIIYGYVQDVPRLLKIPGTCETTLINYFH